MAQPPPPPVPASVPPLVRKASSAAPKLAKTSSSTDADSVLMNHRPPRHPLVEEPYCCCSCSKLRPGIQWLVLVEFVLITLLLIVTVSRIHHRLTYHHVHPLPLTPPVSHHLFNEKLNETLATITRHTGWHTPVFLDVALGVLLSLWIGAVCICFFDENVQIALLMSSIYCERPLLVAPHMALQFIYFITYATDYFYTELQVERAPFSLVVAAERMWLCTLFLFVATFECYMLVEVFNLATYLKKLAVEKRRRYGQLDI